tara:strand:+ start:835 stop:1098 length:264 start_codon:yes stop_codon:yes gene_type:complete
MKKLLLILTIALMGCLSGPEPCEQGMIDVFTHVRWSDPGIRYEKIDFYTQKECDRSVETNLPGIMGSGRIGPSYCERSRSLGCTNLK